MQPLRNGIRLTEAALQHVIPTAFQSRFVLRHKEHPAAIGHDHAPEARTVLRRNRRAGILRLFLPGEHGVGLAPQGAGRRPGRIKAVVRRCAAPPRTQDGNDCRQRHDKSDTDGKGGTCTYAPPQIAPPPRRVFRPGPAVRCGSGHRKRVSRLQNVNLRDIPQLSEQCLPADASFCSHIR